MLTTELRLNDKTVTDRASSSEPLADRARQVATRHRLATAASCKGLLQRLDSCAKALENSRNALLRSDEGGDIKAKSSAWLLDNFYLIQEEIQSARRELPGKRGNNLPQLSDGPSRGLPRIYDVAIEAISHLDGPLDRERLYRFFSAYQSVAPLTLAELWATANMVRLGLIEELCRAALRIARRGSNVPEEANGDGAHDATDAQSLRNGILSLRAMGVMDWREFVEAQSAVERVLREDPAGTYGQMDISSRDHYRRIVERLSRRSPLTEVEVAQRTVALARDACRTCATDAESPGLPEFTSGSVHQTAANTGRRDGSRSVATDLVHRHVGYYLVDEGRTALEKDIGYRSTWRSRLAHLTAHSPLGCYLGGIAIVWMLVVGALAAACLRQPGAIDGFWSNLCVFILLAGTGSQLAIGIVNWVCTLIVPPRPLMKLDFSRGVPAEFRTVVAVPSMLSSEKAVHELVRQLERQYLANHDSNILFALLTDFPDAAQEELPGDRRLLTLARSEIGLLNARYCGNRPAVFFLLHRPRLFNQQERTWMSKERKRGKLAALNRLVLTGDGAAFSTTLGDLQRLASVRYVITLDADTRLPRDSGRKLVGCMAHPLNRPQIDPRTGRVVKGYAILQPRVGIPISEASRTQFSRIMSGDPGIDPYTRQTSDVYHDVFGEGSFIGKGIYDVRAVSIALDGRFPDNRVLSHDLIEGCYARSGLVNDVELFEGLPSRFLAEMNRRHRWIRGDWQLASWLGRYVPVPQGKARNPLDGLSHWKIFDNLRRSLMPPFLMAFLLFGWTVAPSLAAAWTMMALLLTFGQPLASSLPGFVFKPQEKPLFLHLKDQGTRLVKALSAEAIPLCVLPYIAERYMDAIVRTLYRLCVSKTRLLEWTTASDAEAGCPNNCGDHYAAMWFCPMVGLAALAMLAVVNPWTLPWAGPVLAAWLVGPLVAWWISRSANRSDALLRNVPEQQVRRWARQTWHYFESFMNDREHWLPPDNVQEHFPAQVATRTSPTNIGMGLLSGLAAYDLGYLPGTTLINRTRGALQTMCRLERYRGHFYNWYDTRTLQPIAPRYISSVDSGNLWGALTVLAVGLDELRHRSVVPPRFLEGLHDTLEVIMAFRATTPSLVFDDSFDVCLEELRSHCSGASPHGARVALEKIREICRFAARLAGAAPANHPPLRQWTRALSRQSTAVLEEVSRWAFWLQMPLGNAHFPAPLKLVARDPRMERIEQAFTELRNWIDRLDTHCTLGEMSTVARQTVDRISRIMEMVSAIGTSDANRSRLMLASCRRAAERAAAAADTQNAQIRILTDLCLEFGRMDFRFLFHPRRKLLSIGFQVSENRRDDSYYDLLASEARLTSYLAVSHGQLPVDHWFALGRAMTLAEGQPVLLSWSGSMFEYLMPALLMPSYSGTLLEASCGAAVERQICYARRLGVAWGISESCYNQTDALRAYQYRAHGVPGLGLKRGLGEHLVVAPYASAMAMMVAPREASRNLAWLERQGCLSPHGFYDAIDFSPESAGASFPSAPCRTVMAHHSGMTLLALDNVLLDAPMPRRFLKAPPCAAHDLLLQERMPLAIRPINPETRNDERRSRRITALRGWNSPPVEHAAGTGSSHSAGQRRPGLRSPEGPRQ
jgi:cyclic beta-1,2-glucan synthetase